MACPTMATEDPTEALALLQAGNARFVAGHPRPEPVTPKELALHEGQSPFAVVLGCSDSRVPIETIFDQPPGQIFVIRVAGNFLNADNLASIEFAIQYLKSKIVVVLGHTNCGAVSGAVSYAKGGIKLPGHIHHLVDAVAPSVEATRRLPGDWIANAVEHNVERNAGELIAHSDIVAAAVAAGDLRVIGGIYDLRTGSVSFA
ncbi:MAG TPA: carbonic anhydrase [Candidatus Cybelea sp.]|jgi:carbonic anhydrase|nr:carbonic anhydrase [Candidatus Cybelea sp.]